jgi:hypothetical protein
MARANPTGFPTGHGSLGESLLFVFPLFLLYGVGLMFTPTVNGVDFVSRLLFAAVDNDRRLYLYVHLGLAVVFMLAVLYLRRVSDFRIRHALPMVLEAAIYALTLGTLILFVMQRLFGGLLAVSPEAGPAPPLPILGDLVLAAGAGLHEELVFRLGMMSCGAFVLERLGVRRVGAVAVAAIVSSILFAAAHHVGPYGEPWTRDAMVYRSLAGLAFAAIYWFRSLGHAVYAHFLYDVYVMLARS